MVSESKGSGVIEERLWCYRVMVIMLHRNSNGEVLCCFTSGAWGPTAASLGAAQVVLYWYFSGIKSETPVSSHCNTTVTQL
jgi:hypothetical protein